MAGLMAYALAGAAAGAGRGMVERARMMAEAALQEKQDAQRAAERAEERDWQMQDASMARGWDLQDMGQKRAWDLQDAAAERKPMEDATAAFNRLFGGGASTSPGAVSPSRLRDEMVRRGLPQHVAEAFVLEMDEESGLRPGINEASPTVAGSRGGFGLYQLTGPRRVAYERFASANGKALDDPGAQLDFLVEELKGPERDAASAIMSTRDRNEAGAAIAKFFLRPREDHLARRVAKYANAQPDRRAELQQLLGLPGLNDGQRAVIKSELEKMEPPEAQSARGKEMEDRRNGFLPAADSGFRPASKEEAAQYGAPAGQFGPDGRFYPINPPSGMTVFGPDGKPIVQTGSSGARFTEGQSKDNVYSTKARGALPDVDAFGDALAGWADTQLDKVPLDLGRYMQSEQYKLAQNAGMEFLAAVLRKETGAAVTPSEQEMYGRTYLPRPGDPVSLLKRKKEARARAVAAIEAGMSPEQILAQERALQESGSTMPGDGTTDADLFSKYGLQP